MGRRRRQAIMNKGWDYNTFIAAVQSLVIENHRRRRFMFYCRAGARADLPAQAPRPEVRRARQPFAIPGFAFFGQILGIKRTGRLFEYFDRFFLQSNRSYNRYHEFKHSVIKIPLQASSSLTMIRNEYENSLPF